MYPAQPNMSRRSRNPRSPLPVPTSAPMPRRDDRQASPRPQYRNRFEAYLAQIDPNYRPETDAELMDIFHAFGAAGETFSQFLERHNKVNNDMMERSGGVLPTIGGKPQEGEDDDVQFFPIPNSGLCIRIWSGGMQACGQYCLDYFDPATKTPVKAPEGHQIWPIPRPGVFSFAGALKSWEDTLGCGNYTEGTERYSVQKGSWWTLVRPGFKNFSFAIPTRSVGTMDLALPVRHLP
ncbi:hypothetical protein OF83DRAFT_56151 [Amylostereum chailletii]|nr:hypothetical protein OF83DRAFT_56151 [Amylostereum chailletii]